ncbi:hypothetical protein [Sedimenticola thiotaurini]|uniref:hypothetical protein n=1 Tax=Sedimenticola thiotaurini TaxID=1543721 RepID=UPI001901114B|nr:hypothetical protein [Sedimenticola thiotaurini]
MSVFIRKLILLLTLASPLAYSPAANAIALDIGTYSGSGCCSFGTRGYWFEAQQDFVINALDVSVGGANESTSTLEVLSFNSPIPDFPSLTNDFTSLFYQAGSYTASALGIQIYAGDLIGILGYNGSVTPYSTETSGYVSSSPIVSTLSRLGFQNTGMASNVWTESDASIGFIQMDYTLGTSSVPIPAPLALIGLGLLGMGLTRKRS